MHPSHNTILHERHPELVHYAHAKTRGAGQIRHGWFQSAINDLGTSALNVVGRAVHWTLFHIGQWIMEEMKDASAMSTNDCNEE